MSLLLLLIHLLIYIVLLTCRVLSGFDKFDSSSNNHQYISNGTYELLHYGQDNSWREYLSEIYMIDVHDDVNVDILSKRFKQSSLDILLY